MTRVKTDYNSKGYKHRTHRCKKGRRRKSKLEREKDIAYKQKKLAILIKELNEPILEA
jgi:hypothetical protein